MGEEEKFDAIVIGAGPAGAACAYTLAKAGKSVLMIERGTSAGNKNLTGGRVYTYALDLVEPGLYKEAPLERQVVREQIMMIGAASSVTVDYFNPAFGGDAPQSYTVLRAVFDEWFAAQAETQGAMVATGIKVDEVVEKDGRIVGVKAGEDEMYADVVVAADGVNCLIAQQAGLRQDITAPTVGVGVKEIIELPAQVIQDRFNVPDNQGVARVILGCSEGIPGGGFLYTNKESVSLGIVFNPEKAATHGKSIHEIFQDFKMHPAVSALLGDGTTVEYGAHLVPEAGWRAVPKKLYREGLLLVGDAAGFVINTGTSIRGIDLAMVSGVAAARAVLAADSPAAVGPAYMKQLEELKLIPTMKLFAGWPEIMEIPRMFTAYPALANDALNFMFTVNGQVPDKMTKAMMKIAKQHVTIGQMIADGWKGVRAI